MINLLKKKWKKEEEEEEKVRMETIVKEGDTKSQYIWIQSYQNTIGRAFAERRLFFDESIRLPSHNFDKTDHSEKFFNCETG